MELMLLELNEDIKIHFEGKICLKIIQSALRKVDYNALRSLYNLGDY